MLACGKCGESNPEHARFCSACGSPLVEAAGSGSRREVTVLFCDLVGSTALGERLDPESVRVILHRYFDAMRMAIERHGGRVEKFIGDAVMAVFGVPRLHEDDAMRAVRAASDMRRALVLLNEGLQRDWGLRLDTRIGIASGGVVTGEERSDPTLVTGAPVNLAARLEQAADGGEILLSGRTFRLVRYGAETEPVESLSLKGFGDSVEAYRLLGSVQATGGTARRRESALVDRKGELALLRRTFRRAVAERRCELLTVLGPPGVGKSRLVDGLREVAGSEARWLEGRCLSYGEGITFWPVAEIVKQATGLADADQVPAAARKIVDALPGVEEAELVAARIGQLLGLFGGPPAPEETFWAIRRFVEAQARWQPLILVLEDIHWAEPTFLAAIEHIVERSQGAPILVLCLARNELLDAHPAWAEPKEHTALVVLDPLGSEDTSVLVDNLLGAGEIPAAIRDRIVDQAEGFPLYAEEIVSAMLDEGRLVLEGGRWVPTSDLSLLALPTTISGLIAARLDRLEVEERAVIERASVVGRDVLASEVAALSASEHVRDVEAHLEALVRKELLRPAEARRRGERAFRFRHMLILDAAYDAMRKTTRAELHERYADWLEAATQRQTEKYEEVIAYHLERAHQLRSEVGPAGEPLDALARRAAHRLSRAGQLASARGDMPASANLLGRALRLLPRGTGDRNALLHDLGLALWQAGEIDDVEAVYREELEAGQAAGDPILEARSRLALAELKMEVDPAAITLEELRDEAEGSISVFEAAGVDEDLAEALLILGTTYWLDGKISRMLDVSVRALDLSRGIDSVTGATNYVGRALVLGTAHCDEALTRLEALVGEVADERMTEATVGLDLATIYAMVDRPDDAAARVERSLSVFEELGQGRWVADGKHTAGLVSWLGDDAEAAERAIRAAHHWYERRGEVLELALSSIDLAHVLLDLDRIDEASAMADVSASSAAPYDLEAQIGWRTARAKIFARSGRHAEAMALVRESMDLVSGTEFLNLEGSTFRDAADVLARAGRTAEATEAAGAALAHYQRKGNRVGSRRTELFLRAL
ncbi:MAG: adenylate/guanylate cyclase domain-containing protein [Actinomycetota bacterium]